MSGQSDPSLIQARFAGTVGAFRLDVDFSFPATGVTAVVGPSGCGKTTLLRCIAGLARLPGRLTVRGETWQDHAGFLPAHRRPLGYVFQETSLFRHLKVRENLNFGLRRRRAGARIAFDQVVDLLGVEPLLSRPIAGLSGGERQRVAIGRALLAQPRLLLMDEPMSGLDAAGKADILPYLVELHRAFSIPILYVSHDRGEVARLADRVVSMRAGRIVPPTDGQAEMTPLAQARAELARLAPEQVSDLALAALLAGLGPD